jgi:hypothetical protein
VGEIGGVVGGVVDEILLGVQVPIGPTYSHHIHPRP